MAELPTLGNRFRIVREKQFWQTYWNIVWWAETYNQLVYDGPSIINLAKDISISYRLGFYLIKPSIYEFETHIYNIYISIIYLNIYVECISIDSIALVRDIVYIYIYVY